MPIPPRVIDWADSDDDWEPLPHGPDYLPPLSGRTPSDDMLAMLYGMPDVPGPINPAPAPAGPRKKKQKSSSSEEEQDLDRRMDALRRGNQNTRGRGRGAPRARGRGRPPRQQRVGRALWQEYARDRADLLGQIDAHRAAARAGEVLPGRAQPAPRVRVAPPPGPAVPARPPAPPPQPPAPAPADPQGNADDKRFYIIYHGEFTPGDLENAMYWAPDAYFQLLPGAHHSHPVSALIRSVARARLQEALGDDGGRVVYVRGKTSHWHGQDDWCTNPVTTDKDAIRARNCEYDNYCRCEPPAGCHECADRRAYVFLDTIYYYEPEDIARLLRPHFEQFDEDGVVAGQPIVLSHHMAFVGARGSLYGRGRKPEVEWERHGPNVHVRLPARADGYIHSACDWLRGSSVLTSRGRLFWTPLFSHAGLEMLRFYLVNPNLQRTLVPKPPPRPDDYYGDIDVTGLFAPGVSKFVRETGPVDLHPSVVTRLYQAGPLRYACVEDNWVFVPMDVVASVSIWAHCRIREARLVDEAAGYARSVLKSVNMTCAEREAALPIVIAAGLTRAQAALIDQQRVFRAHAREAGAYNQFLADPFARPWYQRAFDVVCDAYWYSRALVIALRPWLPVFGALGLGYYVATRLTAKPSLPAPPVQVVEASLAIVPYIAPTLGSFSSLRAMNLCCDPCGLLVAWVGNLPSCRPMCQYVWSWAKLTISRWLWAACPTKRQMKRRRHDANTKRKAATNALTGWYTWVRSLARAQPMDLLALYSQLPRHHDGRLKRKGHPRYHYSTVCMGLPPAFYARHPNRAVRNAALGLRPTARLDTGFLLDCRPTPGPTLAGIGYRRHVPNVSRPCAHNEFRSLVSRALADRGDAAPGYWEDLFARSMSERWWAVEHIEPTPFAEWLRRYPRHVRAKLIAGYERYLSHVDYRAMVKHSAFVKMECVMKTINDMYGIRRIPYQPRCIQACTPERNAATGPHFHAFAKRIAGRRPHAAGEVGRFSITYGCGMTANDLNAWLAWAEQHFGCPIAYLSVDAVRLDASMRVECLTFNIGWYRVWGMPGQLLEITKAGLRVTGRTRNGIRYSIDGTTASGRGDTSLGDSLAVSAVIHDSLKGFQYLAIVQGDDAAILVGAHDAPAALDSLRRTYRLAGFEADLNASEHRYDMEFCSGRWWPAANEHGFAFGPKPGRLLPKLFWAIRPSIFGRRPSGYCRAVCLSLAASVAHLPVASTTIDHVLQLTTGYRPIPIAPVRQIVASDPSPPSPHVFEAYAHIYGVTQTEVLDLCRTILSVRTLPTIIDHPVMTKMVLADAPPEGDPPRRGWIWPLNSLLAPFYLWEEVARTLCAPWFTTFLIAAEAIQCQRPAYIVTAFAHGVVSTQAFWVRCLMHFGFNTFVAVPAGSCISHWNNPRTKTTNHFMATTEVDVSVKPAPAKPKARQSSRQPASLQAKRGRRRLPKQTHSTQGPRSASTPSWEHNGGFAVPTGRKNNMYMATILNPEQFQKIRYPDGYKAETGCLYFPLLTDIPFFPANVSEIESPGSFLVFTRPTLVHPVWTYRVYTSANPQPSWLMSIQNDRFGLRSLTPGEPTVAEQEGMRWLPKGLELNCLAAMNYLGQDFVTDALKRTLSDGTSLYGYMWASGGSNAGNGINVQIRTNGKVTIGDTIRLRFTNGVANADVTITATATDQNEWSGITTTIDPLMVATSRAALGNACGRTSSIGIRILFSSAVSGNKGLEIISLQCKQVTAGAVPTEQIGFVPIEWADTNRILADADRYRPVSCSALSTYQGSTLNNGGRITQLAYQGGEHPLQAGLASYDAVSIVNRAYEGPMMHGAYSFYTPASTADTAMRPVINSKEWKHPYFVTAGTVSDLTQAITLRLKVCMNFEFITPSRLYDTHSVPAKQWQIDQVESHLSRCPTSMPNDSHLSTIYEWAKDKAKSVASFIGENKSWLLPILTAAGKVAVAAI